MLIRFSIFIYFMSFVASAQENRLTESIKDSSKLNMDFLVGSWLDSSLNKIEFKSDTTGFRLVVHDAYSYEFIKPDKFPFEGVSMTWPPHDCTVKKIDGENIEIIFTLFGGTPTSIKYKRVKL